MSYRETVPAFNIKMFADQELTNKNTESQASLRAHDRIIDRPVVRPKNKSVTSVFKWESISNIYCKNEELNRMIEKHLDSTSHEALIEKIEKKSPHRESPVSPGFRKVSELISKVRKSVNAAGPSLVIKETEGEEMHEAQTMGRLIKNNGQINLASRAKRSHKKDAKSIHWPAVSLTQHSIATKTTEDSFSLSKAAKKKEYKSEASLMTKGDKQFILEVNTPTKISHAESVRARVSQYAIDYMKKAGMAKKENPVKAYLDFSRKHQKPVAIGEEPVGLFPKVSSKEGLYEKNLRLNNDFYPLKKFYVGEIPLVLSASQDTELSKTMTTSPSINSPNRYLLPIRSELKKRTEQLSLPVR